MGVYTFTHKGREYSFVRDLESLTRKKRLGEFGEFLAPVLLRQAGFTKIENLNLRKSNHEDADFLAEREGAYLISVKARNKWTSAGKPALNTRYRLNTGREIEECLATAHKYKAEFSWLAISVDDAIYSAYFGTYRHLLSLGLNGKGVVMTDNYTRHYEALALDEPHALPSSLFSNR